MDNIVNTPVVGEVEQSFLDYALSVITDRAIPAVEDGLKPVMRRILYEMLEDGITSNKQYVKCATPVGQTMSKYHPHGDSSIYGALVYASQPWNMRYPLIDFHGNNGSRDGDGPAAHRYTECRLSPIAEATLANIKKNTVDWIPTYAETSEEPIYLPGRFPNLLCNGTTGIAVAMACSFAPHNLNEIMDAAIYAEEHKDATLEDLLKFIKGPDFPTGGTIINQKELINFYKTGKGKVVIRGDYEIEHNKNHDVLVFTSIPFKVSKEALTQEIDNLCEEKKLEGITEIRDESNKKGVRFVIELAKGVNGDVIANKLFHLTNLEMNFNVNQVALVDKTPHLLNFKDLMDNYLKHQEEVFYRRNLFDYNQLSARLHILAGLMKAITNIDDVIALIKKSEDASTAKANLMTTYQLTELQAQAILNMKISKLAHTEKIALEKEISEKEAMALHFFELTNDPEKARQALADEFREFKRIFGDARRTEIKQIDISSDEKELSEILPENCVVIISEAGNIKRVPSTSYRAQRRNGKGIKNQDEIVKDIIKTNTIDNLFIFSSFGKVYKLSVNDIPSSTNSARGVSIETLVKMDVGEKFVAFTSTSRAMEKDQFVWFITQNGIIKKTSLAEYTGVKRKTGIIATNVKKDDRLVKVFIGKDTDLIITTQHGMCLRINGKEVSPSSRTAIGVKGISLNKEDSVVDMISITSEDDYVALFTADGLAKRLSINEFNLQKRAGKGLLCYKTNNLITSCGLNNNSQVLIVGMNSSICLTASNITLGGRGAQGTPVIKDNGIISVTRI